jgi:hypothetical protein
MKELNTEQIIIKAAEAEFLEKGYGNARTVSIRRHAKSNIFRSSSTRKRARKIATA